MIKKPYILFALQFSLFAVPELVTAYLEKTEDINGGMQPPLSRVKPACNDPPRRVKGMQSAPHFFGLCTDLTYRDRLH